MLELDVSDTSVQQQNRKEGASGLAMETILSATSLGPIFSLAFLAGRWPIRSSLIFTLYLRDAILLDILVAANSGGNKHHCNATLLDKVQNAQCYDVVHAVYVKNANSSVGATRHVG